MSRLILMFIFLFPLWVHGEEEIIVQVATEADLVPLVLNPFKDDQSGFSKDYVKKLEDVLRFDLSYNGMNTLSNSGAYTIDVRIHNKTLDASIKSNTGKGGSSAKDVPLSGNLNEDRRIIHKLADSIHKMQFGVEGIATSRFLYTNKISKGGKSLSEVWEADYDGHNAVQITRNGGYCVNPCYVPPNAGSLPASILYVSYKTGQPKIYISSLQDGVGKRISYLGGNQFMPIMNRQRDQMAFISDVTGNPDLFILPFGKDGRPSEKPRKIFTTPKGTQGTPTFSPDGKKIAFVSNKDGSPRIYTMDVPAEGTPLKNMKPQLVSKACQESTAPAWSPDGTKIAFCATVKGVRQIWVYDVQKKTEKQLTQGTGNKENPAWASNSLHLVFNSTGANNSELYLVNLKQPKVVKVSSGPGEKHFPNFSP
jgi:TolB protein